MTFTFVLVVAYLFSKARRFKIKKISDINRNFYEKYCDCITRIFKGKNLVRINQFYIQQLRFTKINLADLLAIKAIILIITIVLILSIRETNIDIITKKIIGTFEYKYDAVYEYSRKNVDIEKALNQEITLLDTLLSTKTIGEIRELSKGEIKAAIRAHIKSLALEMEIPEITAINKVYHRAIDYVLAREINAKRVILIIIFCYSIPEIALFIFNFFSVKNAKKELRFLKRLIILNGSIEPVNFMELLSILISKSKYYSVTLKEIQKLNYKNSIDSKVIYLDLVSNCKDIDVKLFYEKLDQANNYNFSQAIKNIKSEFYIEKRRDIRAVKKQMELINAIGIIGCFLIIAIMTMYMLVPWLFAYDMSQFV
ncbi:hypothetical protein JYU21_00330 [Alkaliphilus sp. AH-315-G20]|nr:hypothetical protein [Alkaliphilus sp. AH-315-G20]